jgi:hypothetical protein
LRATSFSASATLQFTNATSFSASAILPLANTTNFSASAVRVLSLFIGRFRPRAWGVTQRMPPGRFDSRDYARAYSSHSLGHVSGSGSARLDLSQKGDLPSSGEWIVFIWSKAADAR